MLRERATYDTSLEVSKYQLHFVPTTLCHAHCSKCWQTTAFSEIFFKYALTVKQQTCGHKVCRWSWLSNKDSTRGLVNSRHAPKSPRFIAAALKMMLFCFRFRKDLEHIMHIRIYFLSCQSARAKKISTTLVVTCPGLYSS